MTFARVYNRLERRLGQALAAHGVSLSQFDVLATLLHGEGITQQDLAERLLVTKGNVVGLINRIEAAGWVERRPDPEDRRANRLYLTDAGRKILSEVFPWHARDVRPKRSAGTPRRSSGRCMNCCSGWMTTKRSVAEQGKPVPRSTSQGRSRLIGCSGLKDRNPGHRREQGSEAPSMRIFISAGEPSGDLHAANLIRSLRRRLPDAEFVGYGGAKMAERRRASALPAGGPGGDVVPERAAQPGDVHPADLQGRPLFPRRAARTPSC